MSAELYVKTFRPLLYAALQAAPQEIQTVDIGNVEPALQNDSCALSEAVVASGLFTAELNTAVPPYKIMGKKAVAPAAFYFQRVPYKNGSLFFSDYVMLMGPLTWNMFKNIKLIPRDIQKLRMQTYNAFFQSVLQPLNATDAGKNAAIAEGSKKRTGMSTEPSTKLRCSDSALTLSTEPLTKRCCADPALTQPLTKRCCADPALTLNIEPFIQPKVGTTAPFSSELCNLWEDNSNLFSDSFLLDNSLFELLQTDEGSFSHLFDMPLPNATNSCTALGINPEFLEPDERTILQKRAPVYQESPPTAKNKLKLKEENLGQGKSLLWVWTK